MIEGLKPVYSAILKPVGRLCAHAGIHPNVITAMGVLFFGAAGWLTYVGQWKLSLALVIVGACMDGIDGLVAREYGKKTLFGAIFDSTCDRITEIVWIGGICAYYGTHAAINPLGIYLSFAALSGSLMVSYVKARAEGAGIPCAGGILQRPERIIILAVAQAFGPALMLWGLGIIAVVGYATVFQRLLAVAAECRRRQC